MKRSFKSGARAPGCNEIPGLAALRFSQSGKLVDLNEVTALALGSPLSKFKGQNLASLLSPDSINLVGPFLRSEVQQIDGTHRICLRHIDGESLVSVLGVFRAAPSNSLGRTLEFIGAIDSAAARYLDDAANNDALLKGFIELSSEAMWCMEYTEPVDIAANAQEIVRQVFENKCHWRMCNRAMARLYNLPDGLDFNRQPISAYFRRSPENEAFVRQLIAARFHIDSAPSLDVRHDGTLAFIENTVRSDIDGTSMLRLWGTVRDVTQLRTTENKLAEQRREVTEILQALPDPVLVVDLGRRAVALNPAFETTFGWTSTRVLGQDVSNIIDLEARPPNQRRWFADNDSRWVSAIRTADGKSLQCDVRIARMGDGAEKRFVLAMRPTLMRSQRASRITRVKS